MNYTYIEYRLRPRPARIRVLLAQRDELLSEPLRLFGFGPGRLDGFVGEDLGEEV